MQRKDVLTVIETIKRVEGIADRTEKEFKALEDIAKELGNQTKLSCVANALNYKDIRII